MRKNNAGLRDEKCEGEPFQLCVCVCLCVCLSVRPYACVSVRLSVCVYVSVWPMRVSMCLCVRCVLVFVCLLSVPLHPRISVSVVCLRLSVTFSLCLGVCVCVRPCVFVCACRCACAFVCLCARVRKSACLRFCFFYLLGCLSVFVSLELGIFSPEFNYDQAEATMCMLDYHSSS